MREDRKRWRKKVRRGRERQQEKVKLDGSVEEGFGLKYGTT